MAAGDELIFAPLGGVGEIGMNLSIYGFGPERRRTWLAVDLGVAFGSEELLPGIDLIMPDVRFLAEERRNLVGLAPHTITKNGVGSKQCLRRKRRKRPKQRYTQRPRDKFLKGLA